jgi:hypothetical protein
MKLIKARVTQGSVLGPVSYLLYINDMPTTLNNTIAIFAEGVVTVENSTRKLQAAVNKVDIWHILTFQTRRIDINQPSSMVRNLHMSVQRNKLL